MMICILGRQPAIGRAELESLYGADAIQIISDDIVQVNADVDITRLGGTIKTALVIDEIDSIQTRNIVAYCKKALPDYVSNFPEGKIKFGLSFYNLEQNLRTINAAGLELKKIIKLLGRSIRTVPNQAPELSSAQTLHNQLTSPVGLELAFIRNRDKTIIAHVNGIQNIEAYALRDRSRPKRDTKVGMLPPKLAQIIINLATGAQADRLAAPDDRTPIILDPFCGTGVVLQEAALMGYSIYGTDLEERMIRYTRDNINWLFDTHHISAEHYYEVADATDHTWRQPVDIVACEGYLGTPFANEPTEEALRDTIGTCNIITKKFLKNIHAQLGVGTRICIAAPAWFVRGKVNHLPLIDDLLAVGYRRVAFAHASSNYLTYHRENQIVGRELLVLETV